jgi:hypothetical protein
MLLHFSGARGGQQEPSRPGPAGNLGVPYLSPILVQRHGGRILQPAQAVLAPGARPPATTAYGANTLLIPDSALRNPTIVGELDRAFATVGLTLDVPPPLIESVTRRPDDYDAVAVALGVPRGSIGPTRGRCLAKLRSLLDTEPRRSTA